MGIDYTKPVRTDDGTGFEYAPDHVSRDSVAPRTAVLGMLAPAALAAVALLCLMLTGCGPDDGQRPTPAPGPAVTAAQSGPAYEVPDACKGLAGDDAVTCADAYALPAFGWVNEDGSSVEVPAGPALVKDARAEYTDAAELRAALNAMIAEYHDNATMVLTDMTELPNTDCTWVLGFKDSDGKPGGAKLLTRTVDCP